VKTAACLILSLILTACARDKSADAPKAALASNLSPASPDSSALPADPGPAPSINSARAMQYVREVVAFGPRPIGSANHKKL